MHCATCGAPCPSRDQRRAKTQPRLHYADGELCIFRRLAWCGFLGERSARLRCQVGIVAAMGILRESVDVQAKTGTAVRLPRPCPCCETRLRPAPGPTPGGGAGGVRATRDLRATRPGWHCTSSPTGGGARRGALYCRGSAGPATGSATRRTLSSFRRSRSDLSWYCGRVSRFAFANGSCAGAPSQLLGGALGSHPRSRCVLRSAAVKLREQIGHCTVSAAASEVRRTLQRAVVDVRRRRLGERGACLARPQPPAAFVLGGGALGRLLAPLGDFCAQRVPVVLERLGLVHLLDERVAGSAPRRTVRCASYLLPPRARAVASARYRTPSSGGSLGRTIPSRPAG